jgi:DUF4097 and DUF4098 domain-containing protein YvlB
MKRAAFILMMTLAVPAWLAAGTVDQRRPASRDGVVEIENIAGSVTVKGWDQAEVRVQGTLAAGAELRFEANGKRTEIEVELEDRGRHGDFGESSLEVHVPAGSHVEIEGVNASIDVSGVSGTVEAETVNGSITQSGPAKTVSLQSVNGSIDVSGPSGRIAVEVVNGKVTIENASGELEASTVNGELLVTGGPFTSAGLESVAGSVSFQADLADNGRLDVETVSGSAEILVAANANADFSIATFSGEIDNELGIGTIEREQYVPAKELNFTAGSGGARITVETLSGAISIRKR